jgi:16S rRNA (cytosine967-C5)-methyltransferase
VLDVCAAPGGKTTFAAQQMRNQGRLTAEDTSSKRLELLRSNCRRLGVTCVAVRLAEADSPAPSDLFDRVLVDAPCSNTGVVRRRIDVRWRLRPEEIDRLRRRQHELLARAAQRVKPGGTVIYSTCSLEPEENSGVVRAFLGETEDFRLDCEKELLPFRDEVDGAYVARLVRQSPHAVGGA